MQQVLKQLINSINQAQKIMSQVSLICAHTGFFSTNKRWVCSSFTKKFLLREEPFDRQIGIYSTQIYIRVNNVPV